MKEVSDKETKALYDVSSVVVIHVPPADGKAGAGTRAVVMESMQVSTSAARSKGNGSGLAEEGERSSIVPKPIALMKTVPKAGILRIVDF